MPPHTDSPSSLKGAMSMVRTTSSQSVSKGSPSGSTMNKPKQHKVHAGHVHRRTASYGKNLHKAPKATGDEDELQERSHKPKHQSPSTSPSTTQHVKRNSSTVNLPRTGSKVSIKKNVSNVSLKRNTSSAHVNKTRPITPIRKNTSRASHLDKLKHKNAAQFIIDAGDDADEEEDQDDEWTEESSSPNLTRSNSVSKGNRSHASSPPPKAEQIRNGAQLPHSPPESPSSDGRPEYTPQSNGETQTQSSDQRRPSGQPDADVLTSRLLSGQAAPRLAPELSSVSVNGIPGTHTPPLQSSSGSGRTPFSPYTPSLPSNGISRFLHAPPSSASTGPSTLANGGLAHLHSPHLAHASSNLSALSSRAPSPSPEQSEAIRRAKSVSNLPSSKPLTPTIIKDTPGSAGGKTPASYTFQPPLRVGGNTQARLNLWRDQERVEPLHGPPPTLLRRAPAGMLGTEERRVRQYEGAEAELGYLKRFRNPVVESARRIMKGATAGPKKGRNRERDVLERGLAIRMGINGPHSHAGGSVDGTAENASAGSRRTVESESHGSAQRPLSRAGSRNVRFEVGGDGASSSRVSRASPEVEGAEGIEELLRRLWVGGEADTAEA